MNFMTFHILGINKSQLTSCHIFQRGRSTTNQILIGFNIINQLFLWENQLFLWPFSIALPYCFSFVSLTVSHDLSISDGQLPGTAEQKSSEIPYPLNMSKLGNPIILY